MKSLLDAYTAQGLNAVLLEVVDTFSLNQDLPHCLLMGEYVDGLEMWKIFYRRN